LLQYQLEFDSRSSFFANASVITIPSIEWSALEDTLRVRAAATSTAALDAGGAVRPSFTFFLMTHANFWVT
jgi:hypothetical protein